MAILSSVDRFVPVRPLDAPGPGTCALAWDTEAQRAVRLWRVLPPRTDPPRADTLRDRFLREVTGASAAGHPGLVAPCAWGLEPDGSAWIAAPLVEGASLEDLPLPLEPAVALHVIAGALEALVPLHRAGRAHGALRPNSVLAREDGSVVLRDLGLGVLLAATHDLAEDPDRALCGLAPEQARGEACDARTDVWAMGALLQHLLGGSRHPGDAEVLPAEPRFRELLARSTAGRPADRYPDAAAMLEAVLSCGVSAWRPPRRDRGAVVHDPGPATIEAHVRALRPRLPARVVLGGSAALGFVAVVALGVLWNAIRADVPVVHERAATAAEAIGPDLGTPWDEIWEAGAGKTGPR